MAVTAIGASQGYQTMAKTLNYLTYRTLSEPKTHAILKTIMIFTHKRKVTGGRQTIVAKSFISNDKEALVEKLKHKASILRDPKHTKSIPKGLIDLSSLSSRLTDAGSTSITVASLHLHSLIACKKNK